MKILHLTASGFRGLPDRVFDFAPAGAGAPLDVVIVSGEAGSGKTSLLEAVIAAKEDVGAYGPTRPASYVRAGERTAKLEATWLLSPAERMRAGAASAVVTTASVFGDGAPPIASHPEALRAVFREHSCDRARAKVEYFHAGRGFPRTRGTRLAAASSAASDARLRLTQSNEKYRPLRADIVAAIQADNLALADWVRARGVALAGRFEVRQQIATELRPFLFGKAFDGIEPEGEGYRLRFARRDGTVLDLEELSAGEQQGALFALTFRRLGLDHSIVLVDEPELHVHAADRVRFLQAIVALGRDNQIIAATGSAEIVAAATPRQIVDLSRPAFALRAAG
jgi:predicted ATPase